MTKTTSLTDSLLAQPECLTLEVIDDSILLITLNRPNSANALNTRMGEELRDLLSKLYIDQKGLRCLVLTGSGERVFCAGADLKERNGMSDEQWQQQHAVYEQMIGAFLDCPIPLITAVNGAAFAGGCELAIIGDFAYATKSARFALTEVTLGIMPGAMATQNLPRAVGERRAKEIILTGSPFSAEEAYDWGLVNKLCSQEMLLEETLNTAKKIAANAPLSVRQAKKAISLATQVDQKTGYRFEIEAYNRLVTTEDRREGILSFNEKRSPVFKGLFTLQVLLQTKSTSQAAEQLNVTQPAISASLKKLREYFNDELLIKHNKHMILTSHAAQIEADLNRLISEVDNFVMRTGVFDPSKSQRKFKLLGSDYIGSILLAPLMPALFKQAPNIKIDFQHSDDTTASLLNTGKADIAFAPSTVITEPMEAIELFDEDLVLLADNRHPILDAELTKEKITSASHISIDLVSVPHTNTVTRIMNTMGVNLDESINISSFSVGMEMLVGTELVCIIHKRLAEKALSHLPLRFVPLPKEMHKLTQVSYSIYFSSSRKHDPGINWLVEHFVQQAKAITSL
jgi:enoyl-CoA hydratase/carnithine racemase